MARGAVAILAATGLLSAAGQAGAHPRFVSASPERGAAVTTAPKEIRVTFSEAVLTRGSNFQLTDGAGKPVKTGALARDKDSKTIVLPVAGPLTAGAYTVQWKVAAAGHTSVPGRYRFELKR